MHNIATKHFPYRTIAQINETDEHIYAWDEKPRKYLKLKLTTHHLGLRCM